MPVRHERRDDQRVDRQPRRAGHERRDQNRRHALALVLDGARRHDRRHRAGIRRQQRNERLAVEPDGAHHAVGDERGAREVARVLEHADEEEEQKDLRKEDQHRLHAVPEAIAHQARIQLSGSSCATDAPARVSRLPRPSESGWPMLKTTWKTAMTTTRKMSGPQMRCSRMESRRRVHSGDSGCSKWLRVETWPAHLRHEAGLWMMGRRAEPGRVSAKLAELLQEVPDQIHPGSLRRADQRDGVTEFMRERERIDLAAAGLEQVRHIKQHERRQAERKNRRRQHQLPVEVHAVQHEQHGIRRGHARHVALQHVDRDARVFGVGRERVDAGQIDEREVRAAEALHRAGVVLDRDAGIVRDLLAHSGQPIEECGLAAVGRTDERDGADASGARLAVLRAVRRLPGVVTGGSATATEDVGVQQSIGLVPGFRRLRARRPASSTVM